MSYLFNLQYFYPTFNPRFAITLSALVCMPLYYIIHLFYLINEIRKVKTAQSVLTPLAKIRQNAPSTSTPKEIEVKAKRRTKTAQQSSK
ncbi:hypothetical protein HZS_7180 [Henneguya salminicola]|nr:hypothetical protein HZS_7180 [Henneguya salminicola]